MTRPQMIESINEIYGIKAELLESLEIISQETLSARQAVERAKVDATMLPEWVDLKNDKTRDAFIRTRFALMFANLDIALEKQRMAQHQLTLTNLEIERLTLITKIECEWLDARPQI